MWLLNTIQYHYQSDLCTFILAFHPVFLCSGFVESPLQVERERISWNLAKASLAVYVSVSLLSTPYQGSKWLSSKIDSDYPEDLGSRRESEHISVNPSAHFRF